MEYRQLGQTELKVSVICLGTMTWGEQNTEAQAHEQMDYALEHGVNFMDAAEMYPVPGRAETSGRTEAYIGSWFAARKNREKMIMATKVVGPSGMHWIRGGNQRLNRTHIERAVEGSLKRLQTDYIDLYQLHWPDRDANNFGQLNYVHNFEETPVPLLETLEVLGDLVKAGKIRHVGLSNETPWGTMRFISLSETRGLPRMASIQNPYSLLNRSFEVGLSEVAIREECGLLAYSPLGFGMLTGKYEDGQKPSQSRLTLFHQFTRYSNPQSVEASQRYVALAREHGLNPAQMALAFVNQQPFVTSNIIGATTMAQLKENIDSIHASLNDTLLAQIDAIHREIPNPAP